MLRERLDHLEVVGVAPVPAAYRAAGQRQMRMRDDARRIEELLVKPSPSQVVQAPAGLLNENSFGSSIGTL
jgi:hypothetical protein